MISMLYLAHTHFPFCLWCQSIEQAEITLNLPRTSRIHRQLSAYQSVCGNFNFTCTPLSPQGIKVIAHFDVENRVSWAVDGKLGYYIGPVMRHYRCYRVYFTSAKKMSITYSIEYTEDNEFEVTHKSTVDKFST